MSKTKQQRNAEFYAKQVIRPVTPAVRVWALLRFPFSPEIREATIQNLMQDETTRAEVERQLAHDSPFRVPRSAFQT